MATLVGQKPTLPVATTEKRVRTKTTVIPTTTGSTLVQRAKTTRSYYKSCDVDTSLVAQVKRAFQHDTARHITGDIYRLTLAKQGASFLSSTELANDLKALRCTAIQYISQTTTDIVVNVTVTKSTINKWY